MSLTGKEAATQYQEQTIQDEAQEQRDPYETHLNESLAKFRSELPQYMPAVLQQRLFVTVSKNLGFTIFKEKDLPGLYIEWRSIRRKFIMTLTDEEFDFKMLHALDECELLFKILCRKSLDGFESILEQSEIKKIDMTTMEKRNKRFYEKGGD